MNKFKRLINKFFYRPKIKIKGKNNIIDYPKSTYLRRVSIKIFGNNNKIIFTDNNYIHNTHIIIGFPDCPINNCLIKIGEKTNFQSATIQIGESNSSVIIGKNCMCSFDLEINCTDQHSIYDENNNLLNKGKSVIIGNHVWLCKEVRIMKNTKIPDGCIVAQRSVVTKNFEQTNCVIAGNPAKVVKQNIRWDYTRPEQGEINEIH